jgi:hypothetical protein
MIAGPRAAGAARNAVRLIQRQDKPRELGESQENSECPDGISTLVDRSRRRPGGDRIHRARVPPKQDR